jgi:hypothetical protein
VLVREFEWDDGNLQHFADKGLTAEDVDAMLGSRITIKRNKRHASGSYKFLGRGRGGRRLTIVVTETSTPGRWRPITGWENADG